MRKIRKVEPFLPAAPKRIRVAAYARVSVEKERSIHSLSAQVSYYSELIQNNPEWEYAGVYADCGISGTSTKARDEFQRLISDCEAGKIDIVLTKSISRFARNTVDLLETVRHLKDLGIEVRFEKENINSMSGDGELMLSILASFAQEESRNISENVKWGTRKRFQQGIPNGKFRIYGYRWEGDKLVAVPEEAKIVKMIYDNYLKGLSSKQTAKQLEEMGVKSYNGRYWGTSSILYILGNITYTGNMLFQKAYVADPIIGKSKINHGELPQYFVENTHEPIISMETYQKVQNERKRRQELGVFANQSINTNCFTSKIKCGICGKSYSRSGSNRYNKDMPYYVWNCLTYVSKGKSECPAKTIPEKMLKKACAEVLGLEEFNEDVFKNKVEKIIVIGTDKLEFHFYDGTTILKTWKSTARQDLWTEKRRREWSEQLKNKAINPKRNQYYEFTGFLKCGCCGSNYRSYGVTYADGSKARKWHCSGKCGNITIKDDTLKELVCDVLEIEGFSEQIMDDNLKSAVINRNEVTFHFQDGRTEKRSFIEKRYERKSKKG